MTGSHRIERALMDLRGALTHSKQGEALLRSTEFITVWIAGNRRLLIVVG